MSEIIEILTDEIVQFSVDEIWGEMEYLYQVAYPSEITEETIADHMNDFARTFTSDFINTLFMSIMSIIGRKISGELDDDVVYFEVKREDFTVGKEFIHKWAPENFHYVCLAPCVFKALFAYRPLYDTLQNKHLLLLGMKGSPDYIVKRVYRGMLFSMEKAYFHWNKQGIEDFLGKEL